jgi:hypothetical protein
MEHVVASFTINNVFGTIYMSIKSQNDLTPHENVMQGFHVVLAEVLFVLIYLSTPVAWNYLPI